MEIRIRQSWESMTYGASADALAETDEHRSRRNYEFAVLEALRAEYPEAEIDVQTVDADIDLPRYPTWIEGAGNEDVAGPVQDIIGNVYDTGLFWA